MRTQDTRRRNRDGFTLLELLVSMGVMALIMAGTLSALTNAYRATETARSKMGLSNNLRIAVDLVVRDFIQVGQGLPPARTIQVPVGTGALRIQRPHGQGSACTEWPAGTDSLPAVSVGPGCGPVVGGVPTDMVTTLAVDSVLDGVSVWSFDVAGHTATVATTAQSSSGLDISVGTADDVRVGDLMMFTKGSTSALVYVTAVNNAQTFTFAAGDPMNLNQFAAILNGTVDDLVAAAPTGNNSASVSRVRMITYYLDISLDPTTPRLIRHMNWGDPNAALNLRGRTVAFGIENLQLSYDMVDGFGNPSNVKMVAADLTTTGACAPRTCSPNQIRKVNVFLAGRSASEFTGTRRFFRNTLSTQVSLRSLALVDRYR
jgi:prepilin-type N-terminal cleavage/methylation domain-containing protein